MFDNMAILTTYSVLATTFVVPLHRLHKEIQPINRAEASKGVICGRYTQKQDPRLLFKASDPHG